jgi:hypothetical protein
LVDIINLISKNAREEALTISEERLEKRLAEEMKTITVELTEKISLLRIDMKELKAEIIKWMFLFWIGQISVISVIMFTIFKIAK